MKKIVCLFMLIGLLLAGCEMPFPDANGATDEAELAQPTAVSVNISDATTPLPDGSGSSDPNVGGGAPDLPAATVEPTAKSPTATIEPTKTAVLPTATPIPPTETAIPATETAVSPTIVPEPTIVPTPVEPYRTHLVQVGESLYRISLQYDLPWTVIAEANGITDPNTIYAGQTLIIPGAGADNPPPPSGTHVVQSGENLYRIGLLYGLPWTVIATANGISDPRALYAGQILIIPAN